MSWNFARGEGAPLEGLWFRSSLGEGFGPWQTPEEFFGSADPLQEVLDFEGDVHESEIAWFLIERVMGSRTLEERSIHSEEDPEGWEINYVCIDVVCDGKPVLTANASIEWGEPSKEGDSSSYASPISCEMDLTLLKEAVNGT